MSKLNFRRFGEGEPLIIMHGLYGSSDNWMSIARSLMDFFSVYILDLRNHGASPHYIEHNYDVMVDDLAEFMNSQQIYQSIILGHSMGGKVAMFFAAAFPERVKKLIVVDISPRTYTTNKGDAQYKEHSLILDALSNLDIRNLKTREDAQKQLKPSIKSPRVLQFLLKNLKRDKHRNFIWKLNINVLKKNLPNILIGLENKSDELVLFQGSVLFIKSGNSYYINKDDEELISTLFNNAKIETIENASHWVHAEKPDEFIKLVMKFMLS